MRCIYVGLFSPPSVLAWCLFEPGCTWPRSSSTWGHNSESPLQFGHAQRPSGAIVHATTHVKPLRHCSVGVDAAFCFFRRCYVSCVVGTRRLCWKGSSSQCWRRRDVLVHGSFVVATCNTLLGHSACAVGARQRCAFDVAQDNSCFAPTLVVRSPPSIGGARSVAPGFTWACSRSI